MALRSHFLRCGENLLHCTCPHTDVTSHRRERVRPHAYRATVQKNTWICRPIVVDRTPHPRGTPRHQQACCQSQFRVHGLACMDEPMGLSGWKALEFRVPSQSHVPSSQPRRRRRATYHRPRWSGDPGPEPGLALPGPHDPGPLSEPWEPDSCSRYAEPRCRLLSESEK